MKKNIILLMITLIITHGAMAEMTIPWTKEGCESVDGNWITAHSPNDEGCDSNHCNGKNFCRSNVNMNWWSALIWCKSIGRELASIEDACPNGLSSGNSCANLKGKVPYGQHNYHSKLSTLRANKTSYVYRGVESDLYEENRNRDDEAKALCK